MIKFKSISDPKGRIDSEGLCQAILSNYKILACSARMYVFDEKKGCFVKSANERRSIYEMLAPDCRLKITSHQIDEVVKRLKSLPETEFDVDLFDNKTNLINVKNGVVNILTFEMTSKSEEYCFSNELGFEFMSQAKIEDAPTFQQYCKTSLVGDAGKTKLLLQIIGYAICNDYSLKTACFLTGFPHSGKSHVVRLIGEVVGKDQTTNLTLSELSRRFSTSQIAFSRLNLNGDIETDTLSDVSMYKRLLGGDRSFAEFKGKDGFMFTPRTHFLYGCNNLPELKEIQASTAYIDRVTLLHFPVSINPTQWDPQLHEKLWGERNVIFSLAVKELSRMLNGNRQFDVDSDSNKVYQRYKDAINPVATFVRECCLTDPEGKLYKDEFFAGFRLWCEEEGISCKLSKLDVCKLASQVDGVSARKIRKGGGKSLAGLVGIKFRDEDEA